LLLAALNLVLFEPAELAAPLPLADPRAQHILKVLRRAPGDTFVAGLVDGPLGVATLRSVDAFSVSLAFSPTQEPPPLPPITLLVGLPRPQTARDLLRDATTLGVACIHFIATERADPNYASSTLWTSGEWRRHLLAGAAQACDTRLPAVTWTRALASALASELPATTASARLALDNYEATMSLDAALCSDSSGLRPQLPPPPRSLVLAFGPERGWGPADRASLRASGFTLCSLGHRVLRLETAVAAALSLARFRKP
jgi:16S rRNA (uracil1498-N3)-methyltransferase